ncbi:hypothetical protein GIB67_030895 [Kingdonia uniflora]|uniref:Myb/SANT-like domain-containing protein n=1 Tax=Kingdonia uniflora TaxID=39325 RepID=A0A7J7L3C7_9MAGN|nr:hypothetical protein GIB67_030895 [Kingdonia uniflora]
MTPRKEERKQRSYLKWDGKMDMVLISTLMGQLHSGQKIGNGWTLAAYNKTSINLHKQIGLDVTSEQCKTRWKTLRSNHLDAKKVVESDGFWLDEKTHMVSAEGVVWKDLIERYPAVKNYRDKVLPHYKELDILVGTDLITGFDETSNNQQEVEKLASNVGQPQPDLVLLEKKLKDIPNLTKDEILRALFYYRENDAGARGFLAVSQDLKRSYLRRELSNMMTN